MDAYTTIEGGAEARVFEKKSEFIAQLSFADTEENALAFLSAVRAKHRAANHNVYAYLLREGARERCSDDGEPAKTSGVPSLEVLRHAGVTNCVLVTTRYFGGTLLGTGGLVRAYQSAAQAVLAVAHLVKVQVCIAGTLQISYALYEQAARLIDAAGAKQSAPVFEQEVTLHFVMLAGSEKILCAQLQELCRGNTNLVFCAPYYAPF